ALGGHVVGDEVDGPTLLAHPLGGDDGRGVDEGREGEADHQVAGGRRGRVRGCGGHHGRHCRGVVRGPAVPGRATGAVPGRYRGAVRAQQLLLAGAGAAGVLTVVATVAAALGWWWLVVLAAMLLLGGILLVALDADRR